MVLSLQTALLALPGVLRLGHLRLPVFGLCAAAGLIAALLLSQRTARQVQLPLLALWDAGLFAIAAAFVASRLLLVVRDPRAFLRYPLLVLALPSLTYGGLALTAVAVGLYLRRQRLPLLRVLDAWAPPAALLAAALALGHFVEGTDAGLPTPLPWGVLTPGDTTLGRVQPVQLYALAAALALSALLLWSLTLPTLPGETAALGLLAGGALAYLLAMLTQPLATLSPTLLEPGQWIALVAIALGSGWLLLRRDPTPPQPAQPHPETL